MSITAINLNFSNGQGGHTASVTEVVGAQDPEQVESLGEVVGDLGKRSSFSHDQVDELMKNFILEGTTTSVDPVKTTKTKQYIDETSAKLNNYVVLVRGINAPPRGGPPFEGNLPYFGEVRGSFAPSMGYSGPVKKDYTIIMGNIYNFNTRAQKNGTKISLVYQSKKLVTNLSQNVGVVAAGFLEEPNLGEFSLKYGYTVAEYLQALTEAEVDHEFPAIAGAEDMLFETSGSLASVTSSIAGTFGLYFYIDPTDGILKFINSKEASKLTIEDPTDGSDPDVINASFNQKAIPEAIVNSYAGTGEKPEPHNPTNNDDPLLFATFFKRVFVEEFDAFKDMNMSWATIGSFFSLFNQDQSPDIFNKFTLICMVLAERGLARGGRVPIKRDGGGYRADEKIEQPNPPIVKRPAVGVNPAEDFDISVFDLMGNVERDDKLNLTAIEHPLYLPIPANTETWLWGPIPEDKTAQNTTAIWPSRAKDEALARDIQQIEAQQADKSHEFRRTKQVDAKSTNEGEVESAADYFNVNYIKTDTQLAWEARGGKAKFDAMGRLNPTGDKEDAKLMAMPMPSESNLYEFLKCFFQIGGGVYVSNGYSRNKSFTMGFENSNNITISGPFSGNKRLRDIEDIEPLNNFFRTMGVNENGRATVRDLAELTNGEAKTVGGFFFIAIRQLAIFEKENDPANVNVFNDKANYNPLATHIEWYHKEGDDEGSGHYLGGALIENELFLKYILKNLVKMSIDAFDVARQVHGQNGDKRHLKVYYQRTTMPIEEEDDEDRLDEDDAVAGGGAEGEEVDLHDKYDSRFYDIVSPEEDPDNPIYMKPALSAASGTTLEMKALKNARGDDAGAAVYTLNTSSKTIYGLAIPKALEKNRMEEEGELYFKPTMTSISISVGNGGIQTTIGESTLKLLPPDQQFIIGQGIESMVSNIISSRYGARQKNYLGL